MSFQKLKNLVASFGGSVEVDIYTATDKAIQCIAPDGKEWLDGNCVNMLGMYYTYIKTGDGSKENTIKELIARVSEGLEDYDETING